MTTYELNFSFDTLLEPFARGDRALIVLRDPEGKFVLGNKHSYPQNISRLVGGGIESGEDPLIAAGRELEEELGVQRTFSEADHLADISISIRTPERMTKFHIHLFGTTLEPEDEMHPSSDIDGVTHLTREEVNALVDRFYDLSDIPGFAWSDYGKLYGRVHEIAMELS